MTASIHNCMVYIYVCGCVILIIIIFYHSHCFRVWYSSSKMENYLCTAVDHTKVLTIANHYQCKGILQCCLVLEVTYRFVINSCLMVLVRRMIVGANCKVSWKVMITGTPPPEWWRLAISPGNRNWLDGVKLQVIKCYLILEIKPTLDLLFNIRPCCLPIGMRSELFSYLSP